MSLLDSLNEEQKQGGHVQRKDLLLLLAGAGSRKDPGADPPGGLSDRGTGSQSLLYPMAITFTNKAAGGDAGAY